ncbi:hypothetical protein RFI_20855 [Reticulomyxa filosa]|uniref:Uncharacterized protein n=1 Tax=Reticulomyxa filosa TaxID=46433 RepID=X6MTQ3_RETFI|nr:hypothetical protein RFI_20855 [Reticulomyxa filosa]|eukprot:ETO16485.1 hypothetical protein RFI_20855 [Reticulomyxa filosa]
MEFGLYIPVIKEENGLTLNMCVCGNEKVEEMSKVNRMLDDDCYMEIMEWLNQKVIEPPYQSRKRRGRQNGGKETKQNKKIDKNETFFQKKLAKENEDVEMKEFVENLKEVKVDLSIKDIKTLFRYIRLCKGDTREDTSGEEDDDDDEDDNDDGDVISMEEFTLFFLTQWTNDQLKRLQNVVLAKVLFLQKKKRKKNWNDLEDHYE